MSHTYTMKISLNVLNHLGINLYSNIPAVLSEVVANAWDASASEVNIDINTKKQEITISDNGTGMTIDDINNKFLHVGYTKREDGFATTEKFDRPVMGRKGIGKLSMFSIANTITITTKKNNETNAFELDANKIKLVMEKNNNDVYNPIPVQPSDFNNETGTKIILSNLKKSINSATPTFLRKRLSRRFSIIGQEHDFIVNIDKKPILITDRDYFSKIEYLWSFGKDETTYESYANNVKKTERYENIITIKNNNTQEKKDNKKEENKSTESNEENSENNVNEINYTVSGWLGLVEKSGDLQDGDDNLNKIVIMVRNKLAQEDLLDEFREGGMFTKYLFGEIHADFLDDDDLEDIATSSRQRLKEDDERYKALKNFIKEKLKDIAKKRAEFKNQEGEDKALKYQTIKSWYEELSKDKQKKAKKLFGNINAIATDEKNKKELFTHGILAFESLIVRDALDSLDEVNIEHLETFLKVFSEFDDVEKTLYHQITSGRIKVIDKLKAQVDKNVLEKVLQESLFEHLWLLDPSWDKVNENKLIEERVYTEFNTLASTLSEDEKKGRLDIKYMKTSGTHVIVELKRASVKIDSDSLKAQVKKYMRGLKKQLKAVKRDHEPIQAVCVLGSEPTDWTDLESRESSINSSRVENISFVTYDQLIHDSYETYKEYISSTEQQSKIISMIKQLEIDFDQEQT